MGNESRNEFEIIWMIVDFSAWCHDPYNVGITSPECTAENLEKSHFHLKLRHTREETVDENYLFCELYSDVAVVGVGSIPIECTMEIIDAGGETLQSEKLANPAVQGYQTFEWKNVIKTDELLNKMKNWTEDTFTVRCHIIGEVKTRQPKIECEAMTKIGVDRCSFLWNMRNPDASNWSESKIFCFPDATLVSVNLSAPKDDVLINIKRERKNQLFVTCRMSLVDLCGSERYSHLANYLFRDDNDAVWKFPVFFTKTILKDNKDTLLRFDAFTLTCNFSVTNGINFKKVRYRTIPLINAPCTEGAVSSLLDDWRNMFTSKKHADVKLLVDNEIFPAHKGFLAVRSPVFSAMFDQDMLESRTGIVDIEDMDVTTMKSFLEFMYTGMVNGMDYEKASKLLIAAERYQVLSLKEKCASYLMSILSEENVCETIALSDMVGHDLLKVSSLDYIKLHKGNVLDSSQWTQWIGNNVPLATEIIHILSTDEVSSK